MNIETFVRLALDEDIGRGDLFERVSDDGRYEAYIVSNDDSILAGCKYVEKICDVQNIDLKFFKHDGDSLNAGDKIATVAGSSVKILASERVILNTLQHASGIATNVRKFSSICSKYDVMLLDTRKTRPLLRIFEKYAAKVGGAINHRMGLDDALMIKDTHRKSIKNLPAFLENARRVIPFTAKIELECETLNDALDAFCLDIDIIMCDNMSAKDVALVAQRKRTLNSPILLEASGGISLDNIEEYCQSGADAISVGSLIHQAVWQDFSMKGIA